MPLPISDDRFVELVFSAALSLLGILIAAVGILLTLYESAQGDVALVQAYRVLTIGAAAVVILAGVTAGLSLAYLRGRQIPAQRIVWPLIALIGVVTVGVPYVIWVRFF